VSLKEAVREHPASAAPRQFLSFKLDGQVYAVPLAQVAEITPLLELNRIPHMPKSVEGRLDHRGQVLPVINLRKRMNLGEQETSLSRNIVVLNLGGGSPVGILVDTVDAVITAATEQLVPASLLLTGPEGAWVSNFILLEERIIALLNTGFITAFHGARTQLNAAVSQDLDQDLALDQGLKELIDLAPPKAVAEGARIIPQMEEAINHPEQEMAKVIDCVESMLAGSDKGFQALVRLKQEAALGRLKGEEKTLAEIERVGTELQERVFTLIQQLQFQDIARQKLERVLNHIRGLQMIVGAKFRDTGKA
jgi:purine-binding chemotaxis protein CheW